MKAHAQLVVWGLLAMLVAACSTLPKPQSLAEQIAYSYGMVASVRSSAAGLLGRGQITVEQARNVQQQADVARQSLDQARIALSAGLPQDAQGHLMLATQVLTAIETYLRSKGGE